MSTKKTIKWSKPIRLDKTWKKFLHIPGHGDVKVIICDKHRVIRINIYYISQVNKVFVSFLVANRAKEAKRWTASSFEVFS